MMEDQYQRICKICKKVFNDMQGLEMHKKTHHSNRTFNDSSAIPHQFRNNNSLSITRIQKEPNVTVQSGNIQNQNTYRRMASSQVSSQSALSSIRRADGVKPSARDAARGKNAASSHRQMTTKGKDVDDDTWQKWEPAHRDRDNGTASTDGTIITSSAAERATSAFCQSSSVSTRGGSKQQGSSGARKNLPQLLRMTPTNGKRPAPGMSSTAQRINPVGISGIRGASGSPVPDIMHNLGKIKSMNAQANNRPSPKVISAPPPAVSGKKASQQQLPKPKPQPVPSFRVNKSPQVSKSKQKIVPRNSFNNALPKTGAQKAPPLLQDDSMDDDDDEDDSPGLFEVSAKPQAPAKKVTQNPVVHQTNGSSSANTNSNSSGGGAGKAPPQKTLHTNRFNPINSTKGNATGPGTSTRNGNSTIDGKAKAPETSSPAIVAKKSIPIRKACPTQEDKMKKIKMYVPKMPGTDYEMPSLKAVGSYTGRNGEQVWICLVCKVKEHEESSRDMICCDICEDWYHWECVGIRSAMPEDDPWYCKRCIFQASTNPRKDFPKLFKNNVPP